MKISVRNSPDKKFTPYIQRAAEFYGKILIPNTRINNNISVDIKFNRTIDNYGLTGVEGCNSAKKARDFLIEIHSDIGARNILETLAHEMVHVKQFAYGEINDSLSVWKGQAVDLDEVDYWWLPWEIEAHGMEAGLLTKFAVKEKLYNVLEGFRNPNSQIPVRKIVWKHNSNGS